MDGFPGNAFFFFFGPSTTISTTLVFHRLSEVLWRGYGGDVTVIEGEEKEGRDSIGGAEEKKKNENEKND